MYIISCFWLYWIYYLPTAVATEGGDPDATPAQDGKPLTNPTLLARAGLRYAII